MPFKWFRRGDKFVVNVWKLRAHNPQNDLERSGWVVEEFEVTEVEEDEFLLSYTQWDASDLTRGLPPATEIKGELNT